MELLLTRQPANGSQIAVTCDGQPSHTFDLRTLIPNDQHQPPHPLEDPVAYGSAVYAAIFPPATPARHQLENSPDRILLVTTDNELDAIPWEYAHGPYGPPDSSPATSSGSFLVLECHFVRGLPTEQRIAPPKLEHSPHIIAIPSNPLSHAVEPLDIESEWLRLREAIQDKTLQDYAITLERTRPPTLARLGLLVASQHNRIVHFMGHGGRDEKKGAILCFEKDNGDLDVVSAKDFTSQIRGAVFLVTLNACVSATPGETQFSNLAAALVRQKTPYALGMRFSIPDDDALIFSRTFYSYLVRGSSVEEAVYQVRLALARNKHRPWLVGMPVLYTALSAPATGFAPIKGAPEIEEHQPRIEATLIPRAEGTFQGRADDLIALGDALTGDPRRRIVTIHGGGGQGKTTLAREAIERFAYAWPAGVWATTLENLPTRDVFVNDLARFLGITPDPAADPSQLERQVLSQLGRRRTLIVLDNAETLVDAVLARNASAIHLAELVKQLPGPMVSLLVTSRVQLGWPEESSLELGGLSPEEGAALFRQSAPQRSAAVDLALAQQLSQRVDGHPLSQRLLGGAFNASAITLPAFLAEYEAQLVKAENKYVSEHHRQRTLYASIETSVRYLDEDHRHLLSGLWLFHAPFLPQTAAEIFDPQPETTEEGKETEGQDSPIYDRLHTLWRRGLLLRETLTLREGTFLFYRLPPTMRPYIEQFLAHIDERETLLARFGAAYAKLVGFLDHELDRGGIAAALALLLREDLERGASCVTDVEQGYYWLRWGWILQRLGYRKSGLELTEQALQVGQEQDHQLKLYALNNMAIVYADTGQPQQALKLYEQALPLMREMGDRAGEAITLNNMAALFYTIGQSQQALTLFQHALPIRRASGDRRGEANTLNNMAGILRDSGATEEALVLHQQALSIYHEIEDRRGEAVTFNNMAVVYRTINQPKQALMFYQQALLIFRELSDRAGEAVTLNNMGMVSYSMGQPQQALTFYQQALAIRREVSDPAGEAAALANMSAVLYEYLDRFDEAISCIEQAIAILSEANLPQDAAGHSIEALRGMRHAMGTRQTYYPATLTEEQLHPIITKTIAVMTASQDQRAEWHKAIAKMLQKAQEQGKDWQIEVDFFFAVLDILDGKPLTLPTDHPYAQVIASIQNGIAAGGPGKAAISDELIQAVREFVNAENWQATCHIVETRQVILFRPEVETLFEQNIAQAQASGNERAVRSLELHLSILRDCKTRGITATFERIEAAQQAAEELANLPFDPELIPRSIQALAGGPQEKKQCMQYLATQEAQASDVGLKALINTIQLALFGSPLAQLGQDLEGVYRQAWDAIVAGVAQAGGTAS